MLFVIYAAEQQYNGSHGMCSFTIAEADKKADLYEEATELSYEIMDSYSCITEILENDVETFTDETMTDEDIGQLRYDIYNDNVLFEIYPIKPEIATWYSIDALDQWLNRDPEGFIEDNCN